MRRINKQMRTWGATEKRREGKLNLRDIAAYKRIQETKDRPALKL